jgi:hypothetical protein
MKLFEQIERKMQQLMGKAKPWQNASRSHKWDKQKKHRVERRRARNDLECAPLYRKYKGYEW